MAATFDLVLSSSAQTRLTVARDVLLRCSPGEEALVIGASRAAADELAAAVAAKRGGLFGVTRTGFVELATRLAMPRLVRDGLAPSTFLGEAALAARVTFEAHAVDALDYFDPVAGMPGFPQALARTLSELRQAAIEPDSLEGTPSGDDLAKLLSRVGQARRAVGAADYADLLKAAQAQLESGEFVAPSTIILLDVSITTAVERSFVAALIKYATAVVALAPEADTATAPAYDTLGARRLVPELSQATSLDRLQRHLFAKDVPVGVVDRSVVLFSAPGENREAVEIARWILQEAARGVRFDDMAVLLRAPEAYLGVLEHALSRAGIPAWFHRGTRRPDPAGRALLALLACAHDGLSARRFAEYVSLAQVPMEGEAIDSETTTPVEEVSGAIVPEAERPEDPQPESLAASAAQRGASERVIAGTVRAPWRWEDLIVEAAVIGGMNRWERRLDGLGEEYQRRLHEAESDDPESPLARALRRDAEQLEALKTFALPILRRMSSWPESQLWEGWLRELVDLTPIVLRDSTRVLRVLQELAPLKDVGPVSLREVRDVLTPRLSTLMHEPPRRRQGRVFVGTSQAARGRSFKVVFVPGLAERVFPQRIREDALLLDDRRIIVSPLLRTRKERAAEERLHLALAAGAASERLFVSFPRMELSESRPRVPSFYVLDVFRAIEGAIPSAAAIAATAFQNGHSTLSWPAPTSPELAIDEFEHDLATLGGLLSASSAAAVRGRARYLYELSPELRRSLTSRWLRWHRRNWEAADGLVAASDRTTPVLATERLGARAYSLSALQRFASCPYQFLLAAIYRLTPLEQPAPLQRLDPLTRGDLFHRIQATALRRMRDERMLPLSNDLVPTAQKMVEWAVTEVEKEAREKLAPAIDRVWRDEIASMTVDLKEWIAQLAVEGADWTPELFEFAFGLQETSGRDSRSVREPARVANRFLLRGSIDLVERHRKTGFLRVTDHKTGRNRTTRGETVVQGGRTLQPVLYGLALEALWPDQTVFSGRLSFCTAAGEFSQHEIPLLDAARRQGVEVLEIIDRSIERGVLAPRPERDACTRCDFVVVCGRDEERRTNRKSADLMADLEALRAIP